MVARFAFSETGRFSMPGRPVEWFHDQGIAPFPVSGGRLNLFSFTIAIFIKRAP